MEQYRTIKAGRLTEVQQNGRTVFSVIQLRNGIVFSVDRSALPLVSACDSVQQCIDESFKYLAK